MNTAQIQLLSKPKLSSPTFVLGLADQYGVNTIVTQTLITHTRAEKFAELYSPHFPDSVISDEMGLCHLPAHHIYASTVYNPNTVILNGDAAPNLGDTRADYEIVDLIASFAQEQGCKRILSFGAYTAEGPEDTIRVVATTGRLATAVSEKLSGSPLTSGGVNGLVGMIVGAAKLRRLPAVCILAPYIEGSNPEHVIQMAYHSILDLLAMG